MRADQGASGERRADAYYARARQFVAALHVIAAVDDAPQERLDRATNEAFARFVSEARAALFGDGAALRIWIACLRDELVATKVQSTTRRFTVLRDLALQLANQWLLDN